MFALICHYSPTKIHDKTNARDLAFIIALFERFFKGSCKD